MRKRIKYLLILLLVIISFGAGFGVSEYWRKKNRPLWSSIAATAGICAYEDKDIPNALEYLYTAIFLNPSNSDAHLGLGFLFYDQGLYELSLHEFGKYLQNPGNGILTAFSEKEDKKLERLAKHDIAWVYCYIGDIYDKKGDKETSANNYRKASEADPEFVRFIETYIKYINGKKAKQEKDFKKLEMLNKTLRKIREAEKGT